MNKAAKERTLWGSIIVAIIVIMNHYEVTIEAGLLGSILIGLGAIAFGLVLLYLIGGKKWFKNFHDPFD